MRRYERASTLPTNSRPVADLGQAARRHRAVTALLGRPLHHAHVLKCGSGSWRAKVHTDSGPQAGPQSKSDRLDAGRKW